MAVVKGISENQGARMFHVMMIIPAGLLLLLSLISLGTMASANNQVKDEIDDLNWRGGKCVLYTKDEDLTDFKINDGSECEFAIWGGAVLAIVSVALSIVLGAKAFFGIAVFSFLAIIELGISVAGAVWAFIVSVVITAGLDVTCKGFREAGDLDDDIPCCYFFFGESDDLGNAAFFYERVNTSRITAWFAMGLLICLAILYGIIFIMFCCRGGSVRRGEGSTVVKELPESAAQ